MCNALEGAWVQIRIENAMGNFQATNVAKHIDIGEKSSQLVNLESTQWPKAPSNVFFVEECRFAAIKPVIYDVFQST